MADSEYLLFDPCDLRISAVSLHYENMAPENSLTPMLLPGGGTVALRPVTADDDEFLLAVYDGSREEELAQVVWPEGQREVFVRWQFDMQRQEYQARYPDARYEVILVDGRPAGRIWVGIDEGQIHLLDIAILKEFQNRGVGTLLLRRLMDEATVAKKRLTHMVFILNHDALRFYERLEFVVIEDLGAYKHMEWRPR